MKLISARQAWHDAYYQPWDSVMSVAAEWAKLGASVQTTCKSINASHAAHQALAGMVQSAIGTLPDALQAFGHHLYSPIATDDDRELAEDAVFVLAMQGQSRMTAAKLDRAGYVVKGVLYRYRRMNQGGQGGNPDPLEKPESFRAWLFDWYGVRLASENWSREWDSFVEACFKACNELDREALRPIAMAIENLCEAA